MIDRGYALPQDVDVNNRYLMIRRPQQLDEENMETLSRMVAQSELERDMRRHVISVSRNTEWERAAEEEENRLRRTGTWGRPTPSIWEEERKIQQSGNSQEGETKTQTNQDEFIDNLNAIMERSDQAFLQNWRNSREITQNAGNVSNSWNIQDENRTNTGWISNQTREERSGWIRNENRPSEEFNEEIRWTRETDDEFKNMEERNEENKENNLPDK